MEVWKIIFFSKWVMAVVGGLDLVSCSFTDYLIPSVYLNEWLANRLISPNIEIKWDS